MAEKVIEYVPGVTFAMEYVPPVPVVALPPHVQVTDAPTRPAVVLASLTVPLMSRSVGTSAKFFVASVPAVTVTDAVCVVCPLADAVIVYDPGATPLNA